VVTPMWASARKSNGGRMRGHIVSFARRRAVYFGRAHVEHVPHQSSARSVQGQTRKSALVTTMSAFPSRATKLRTSREVRFVPTTVIETD